MRNVNFNEFPKLGFGIMRVPQLPGEEKKIDEEAFKQMLDEYMASGMNYFDTAYVYYSGESEKLLGKYLVPRYDRESYYIADKLPLWSMTDASDCERMFNESFNRLGVDYIDLYLLHSLGSKSAEKIDKFGAYEFMKKIKREGKAVRIGFSFHDTPQALEELFNKYPELEFVQVQINYQDWGGPMQSEEFHRIARKYNKPIIIMEPVRGGALANLSPEAEKILKAYAPDKSAASWALRFCGSLEGVCVTLSGMSNMEQMKDNINIFKNFEPLSGGEREVLAKAREKVVESNLIPCTACRYCEHCPSGIDIAAHFSLYNDYLRTFETEQTAEEKYKSFAVKYDACVECGACEKVCPQHIDIVPKLKKAGKSFV
jgi:predicted aldo/keto reductase-like oxidoreductase